MQNILLIVILLIQKYYVHYAKQQDLRAILWNIKNELTWTFRNSCTHYGTRIIHSLWEYQVWCLFVHQKGSPYLYIWAWPWITQASYLKIFLRKTESCGPRLTCTFVENFTELHLLLILIVEIFLMHDNLSACEF